MFEEITLFSEIANLLIDFIQDEPSYLRADPVFVPFVLSQSFSQAQLGQASSVERSRVVIASSQLPGGINCRLGLRVRNVPEHIPQGSSAEAKRTIQQVFSDAHNFLRLPSGHRRPVARSSLPITGVPDSR